MNIRNSTALAAVNHQLTIGFKLIGWIARKKRKNIRKTWTWRISEWTFGIQLVEQYTLWIYKYY